MRRVAWALLLSGCWSGTAAPPPQSLSNTSPTRAAAPVARERWVGTGRQFDDDSTWDMVLEIDPSAAVGEQLGTIEYPSLPCSGHVIREPDDGHVIVGRERITDDPEHQCIDGGAMLIPRIRGSSFLWRWRNPSGQDLAEATLSLAR